MLYAITYSENIEKNLANKIAKRFINNDKDVSINFIIKIIPLLSEDILLELAKMNDFILNEHIAREKINENVLEYLTKNIKYNMSTSPAYDPFTGVRNSYCEIDPNINIHLNLAHKNDLLKDFLIGTFLKQIKYNCIPILELSDQIIEKAAADLLSTEIRKEIIGHIGKRDYFFYVVGNIAKSEHVTDDDLLLLLSMYSNKKILNFLKGETNYIPTMELMDEELIKEFPSLIDSSNAYSLRNALISAKNNLESRLERREISK